MNIVYRNHCFKPWNFGGGDLFLNYPGYNCTAWMYIHRAVNAFGKCGNTDCVAHFLEGYVPQRICFKAVLIGTIMVEACGAVRCLNCISSAFNVAYTAHVLHLRGLVNLRTATLAFLDYTRWVKIDNYKIYKLTPKLHTLYGAVPVEIKPNKAELKLLKKLGQRTEPSVLSQDVKNALKQAAKKLGILTSAQLQDF